MNIKSDTLNPTSLVLGGPSLDSYHLLWYIRRCMCLFDVSSWEVLHLLEEKKKKLWKQEVDLPDSQNNSKKEDLCCYGVYVFSFQKRLPCCFDI